MFMVWIGLALVLAKWLGVGPLAGVDWMWVLLPLAIAFVWFEFLEELLGFGVHKTGTVDEQQRAQERREQNLRRPGAAAPRRP